MTDELAFRGSLNKDGGTIGGEATGSINKSSTRSTNPRLAHQVPSQRRIRWRPIAILFASVNLIWFITPKGAEAFDDYGILCADDTTASISFTSSSNWNLSITAGPDSGKTLKTAVESGRDMWVGSEIEHWQGGAALAGGSPTMVMHWKDVLSAAVTDCVADVINFDSDEIGAFRNGSLVLSGLAAHEWGHVWGLGHAGRYDSHGGGAPTMSTCWNAFLDQRNVSQDDSAAIQFQTDKWSSFGSATANSSFEEGTDWWAFQNVTSTQMFYSGGQDGSPNYLRFGGVASNSAVFSTTRATDSFYDGDHIGANIMGRANYKKAVTNSTGYVHVVAKWRHVDYPGAGSNPSCQLAPAQLNSSPSIGPFEFQVSTYCYPSTSWAFCTTGQGNITSSDSGGRPPEGVDMRIVVYDHMTYNGDRVSVDIDRTRILWQPS
jgi:hypothetical protein